jgi:hypothetical protein
MITDPTSSYAQAQAFALGRAMDDVIISAATGVAYTGASGTTQTSLSNTIAAGGTGMTLAKLREAKYILDNADVDPSLPRIIVISPKQLQDMLAITEVQSADYNTIRALVSGDVNTYMGFQFVTSTRLAKSGSDRTCFVYAIDGILLAMAKDLTVRVDERPDKSYAHQVYACMSLGATRMEEEKVVSIICQE